MAPPIHSGSQTLEKLSRLTTLLTTATAHKIAIIFYTMVNNQVEYDVTLWAQRDIQREQRLKDKLKRQAQQLGYKLVPVEENPAA